MAQTRTRLREVHTGGLETFVPSRNNGLPIDHGQVGGSPDHVSSNALSY